MSYPDLLSSTFPFLIMESLAAWNNIVDPDQLASVEAILSSSTIFKKGMYPDLA